MKASTLVIIQKAFALNEQAFAKIKHRMRMAQKRDSEDVWPHVGHIVETFSENECENHFGNAGYASVKK